MIGGNPVVVQQGGGSKVYNITLEGSAIDYPAVTVTYADSTGNLVTLYNQGTLRGRTIGVLGGAIYLDYLGGDVICTPSTFMKQYSTAYSDYSHAIVWFTSDGTITVDEKL